MQNGIYFWLGAWKLACEGWGKYEEIGKRACTKVQAKNRYVDVHTYMIEYAFLFIDFMLLYNILH